MHVLHTPPHDLLTRPQAVSAPPLIAAWDRASTDVVLLVDDEPHALAVLYDALEESGYHVLLATSAQEALESARLARPDVILLDASLPDIDGFEVARRLKAEPQTLHIPLIFMTEVAETDHLVAALHSGAVDCVTKPIKPKEVLARMGVHLLGARERKQARNALDAFGYATIAVRVSDGCLLWETPLARELLLRHCATQAPRTPDAVLAWLRQCMHTLEQGGEPGQLQLSRGPARLILRLHQQIGDSDAAGDWLIVMREANDSAVMHAMRLGFGLTAKEAEVLYWLAQGKTNKDIADILGSSPMTVKKHLERVFVKLGVETRTAAAGMVMTRMRQLHPQWEV